MQLQKEREPHRPKGGCGKQVNSTEEEKRVVTHPEGDTEYEEKTIEGIELSDERTAGCALRIEPLVYGLSPLLGPVDLHNVVDGTSTDKMQLKLEHQQMRTGLSSARDSQMRPEIFSTRDNPVDEYEMNTTLNTTREDDEELNDIQSRLAATLKFAVTLEALNHSYTSTR